MVDDEVQFDFARGGRIGLSEAVLCEGKSIAQIEHILSLATNRDESLLLTRLSPENFDALAKSFQDDLDFDETSGTAILGACPTVDGEAAVAVVSAGTSDVAVVREASRTLAFHGQAADEIMDIGVAGLWRVIERREHLSKYRAVIVVAGMDGALFSVVGGLVAGPIIAVPTATGYGAAHGGTTALHSALTSCAPGVVVVNVGNGYGAACAALRAIGASRYVR